MIMVNLLLSWTVELGELLTRIHWDYYSVAPINFEVTHELADCLSDMYMNRAKILPQKRVKPKS